MILSSSRKVAAALAVAMLAFATSPAQPRAGGGFSFGSRGSRTFSAPAPTGTWRGGTSPFQWSEQQRAPGLNPSGLSQPPRRFGFGSGLAAGLLGAGLFGMLTGNGFFGGLGGLASLFGLLVQLALVGGLVALLLGVFRHRFAGPAGSFGGARPGFGPRPGVGPAGGTVPITLVPGDFNAFEQLLGEVQRAYSREDLAALSRVATPEVGRYFETDLEENRRRGVRNEITDVRLLQGDLSEAWRDARTDFATVAMRFGARDVMVDRATGRVVAGDPQRTVEAIELWTFRRDGGPWMLAGVQQTRG